MRQSFGTFYLNLMIFDRIHVTPCKINLLKTSKEDNETLIEKSNGNDDSQDIEKSPNTTSKKVEATNQVLRDSNMSHLDEDRALERLGRLLSASASIFSSKADDEFETKDASETMIQNNNGEDLMSTSDTSSHLWQGISGNDT